MSGPIAIDFFVTNHDALGIRLEDKGRGTDGTPFDQVYKCFKTLELPAPDSHPYPTARRNFKWNTTLKMWEMIDQFGRVNMLSLGDLLEHPAFKPLVESPEIVSALTYYDKKIGGKQISEEDAIAANAAYDPANKPVSRRPGPKTPLSPAGSSAASSAASSTPHVTPDKREAASDPEPAGDKTSATAGQSRKRRSISE